MFKGLQKKATDLVKGKKPIVATFECEAMINRKNYLGVVKSVAKAEQSKRKIEAVAFIINSPGGSPAYSSLIGERVHQFAKNRDVPIYTFAEDYAASGGYWLLCIGDEVYAHNASIVGSIGVISQSSAFKRVLDKNKIGINQVASSNKLLEMEFDVMTRDEISDEAVEKTKWIQTEIFSTFKNHVLKHRATKFNEEDHPKIFNADVFTGTDAKEIGLIDEIGDITSVMKDKHSECEIINFSKRSKWERLSERFSTAAVQSENIQLAKAAMLINRQ